MNDQPELTEEEMQAIQDSLQFDPEDLNKPLEHTVLKMWQEVLKNIEEEEKGRITPAIATHVVSSWPKLSYSEVGAYFSYYYALMKELREDLNEVIASDPECLDRVEDDAIENRELYLEIAFLWSDRIQQWDEAWDWEAPDAHVQIAAIADVSAVFIGQTGLLQHLSQPQVNFQMTEEDREALTARLQEAAKGRE